MIVLLLLFAGATYFAFNQSPRPDPLRPPSLFEELFHPREKNAFTRLPIITGDLHHLFILPETEWVWAVGNRGMILHSRDGGDTWERQVFPVESPATQTVAPPDYPQSAEQSAPAKGSAVENQQQTTLPEISSQTLVEDIPGSQNQKVSAAPGLPDLLAIAFADKDFGFAVGRNGTLLATSDGGRNWQRRSIRTQEDLAQVGFFDRSNAVILNGTGGLLWTDDGGTTWALGEMSQKFPFQNLEILDKSTAVAHGRNGEFLRSENAGQSWQIVDLKTRLAAMDFLDQQTGLVVDGEGYSHYTQDGGKSWQRQSQVMDARSGVTDLLMLNQDSALAILSGGEVVKTSDGGKTWQTQPAAAQPQVIELVQAISPSSVLAVTNEDGIFASRDAGATWRAKSRELGSVIVSVDFIDRQKGLAAGFGGFLLLTEDGGKSWFTKSSGTPADLYSVRYLDRNSALAVGKGGIIVKTYDGGETWQIKKSDTRKDITDIQVLRDGTVIIFASGEIFISKDTGETWQVQRFSNNVEFARGQFSEDGSALVVGGDGIIFRSDDGGETWLPQTSGADDQLLDTVFFDSATALAVGTAGTLLKTPNGGQTWERKTTGTNSDLYAVRVIGPDTAFAAGDGGTILKTQDRGESWRAIKSPSSMVLMGLYAFDSGSVIAVGSHGTILLSNDAGETWRSIEYSRTPALWYWFACLPLLIYATWFFLRKPLASAGEEKSITDLLASDRPLRPGDPDPLNFIPIARGLSRFMRNPSTEPPLTLAITGAWGTGKSSLMNLLFHDLRRFGFTPVWFNAWHHQKGEQLLASLYANIRQQAIPGWLKFSQLAPVGLIFRINLLFRRGVKHWLTTLVLITLFSASATYLYRSDQPLHFDREKFFGVLAKPGADWESILIFLFGNLAPLAALMRAMRAFGLNPANLVTGSGDKANQNRIDPSARQQFAREFNDVAKCLPLGRMVIFIDDLDRCSKENVVDILEAINFLAVSGDCYIVLGMDETWVKICIDNHFQEMAKNNPAFAEHYLEKMVNIRVPVPVLSEDDCGKLLATPEEKTPHVLSDTLELLGNMLYRHRYPLVMLGVVGLGFYLGLQKFSWFAEKPPAPPPAAQTLTTWNHIQIDSLNLGDGQPNLTLHTSEPPPDAKKPTWQLALTATEADLAKGIVIGKLGDANASASLILKKAEDQGRKEAIDPPPNPEPPKPAPPVGFAAAEFYPGQEDASAFDYLLPLASVALLLGGVVFYSLKVPERRPRDSRFFNEALMHWHPWISLNRRTPRAIKRYLNFVRYIAMRDRPEPEVKKLDLKEVLLRFFHWAPAQVDVNYGHFEANLVALSAIYALDSRWVSSDANFERLQHGKLATLIEDKFSSANAEQQSALAERLQESIELHESSFGFPDHANREKFLKILADSRLS